MSSRLNQIGAEWKALVGAIASATVAIATVKTIVEETSQSFLWFKGLPNFVQWLVFGLLIFIAIRLLVSVFKRRSVLIRPQRFLIETERPEQLVGREEDLRDLIQTCEKHRLVFLPGDSGSGKTALVKTGLLMTCRNHKELLPVYIDASVLDWEGGLANELARALKQLNKEELDDLGAPGVPELNTLSLWIEALPTDAIRQLLLIVDQFDDYAIRWKNRLIQGGSVIKPIALQKENNDWALVADGLLARKLRVLFVCRSDLHWALTPVRFEEPSENPPLSRMGKTWVRQLFDGLTEDDGSGETIRDPAFGWEALRARLLTDLARDGGKVLAVQLVVTVEGLQHLRFLTVREYERMGGLTGLEQLHVMAHIEAAAKCGGHRLDAQKLLTGLALLLVTEDGQKTQPNDQEELALEVLGPDDPVQLQPAVAHLVEQRILRRHTASDGSEQLMLYHDFLARGVREAWLRVIGSHELLRTHSQVLDAARTWGQRWAALLSPSDQFRLVWERVRGRIRYGIYRRFAFKSLLKMIPLLLFLATLGTGAWQSFLFMERQRAERHLAIQPDDMENLPSSEVQMWIELASFSEQARLHALEIGLNREPSDIQRRAPWMVHALVGLDPEGLIQ